MTEREVRRALALLYPHRIGQPGFTPLTAGCGFTLKGLYDKAHVCRRRRRLPDDGVLAAGAARRGRVRLRRRGG